MIGLCTCKPEKRQNIAAEPVNCLPSGFDVFDGCTYANCHYRVWSELPDSVCGFKIRALMVSWIMDSWLRSTTTFKLTHRSGKVFTVEDRLSMISYQDFYAFYESHHEVHNDTIVAFCYDPVVLKRDEFNLADYQDLPFFFLDVTFDGRKALLIRNGAQEFRNHYRVFSLGETVKEVRYEPYNHFWTAVNNWMGGTGTTIDYKNKSITVPSLSRDSCSDHGTFIYDVYTLNPERTRFVHTVRKQTYDWCD